jgi:PmbA protein
MDIFSKLQTKAEQVEVMRLRHELTIVGYEANKLKTCKVEQTQGMAVRVVHERRLGFTASSDEKAADKVMMNALESACYGEEIPIRFPAPQPAPTVPTYDSRIAELPIPRLVQIGQEILDLLLPVSPEARINISLVRGVLRFALENQAGVRISFERSPLSIVAEISAIHGDDILIMYDMNGTTVWEEDYMAFARRLADNLQKAKRLTTVRSGTMPVIFSPAGSLVLGIPLMQGLNGKNSFTGISPMKGKVGQKLFDEKITLVDDAALAGKFRSAPFDDEGVAHRRNVFIEKGVLTGFYYDLRTAALSGAQSTGNGLRSLFAPPNPAPTNLLIQPGAVSLDAMISGIDEGLLVEDVIGMGQGNVISGAFSNPLGLAFKIEKGEICGRVKNAAIAGNIYKALTNVSAVSRETAWVYNTFNLPYILLPEINVTAKER